MSAYESDFRSALSSAGLDMPGDVPLIVDDQIHRWAAPNDKEKDAYYALHLHPSQSGEPIVNGIFGRWGRVETTRWCSRQQTAMTREEAQAVNQATRDILKRQADEERAGQEKARNKCRDLFAKAPRVKSHDYLLNKRINPSFTTALSTYEVYPNWLAIPLQDSEGVIQSAQFIADDGTKRFFFHGKIKGCYHQFADVNHGGPLIICEGYATGASLHMATGWSVACAMNCGNLDAVAKSFRSRFPDRTIIIAADNDQFTEGNPGITHGKSAARAAKALLAIPEFPDEAITDRPTDFNDLQRIAGLPEVQRQVHTSIPQLKILAERRFNPLIEPPPLRQIYVLDGKTICTPGNLSSITSAVKTGKTTAVCAMMASAFPHPDDSDLLGFESENPKNYAVIHIDSEQSPDDHWHQISRMLRRVSLKVPPPWFYSYCLTGLGHKAAMSCFVEALNLARDRHGGLHSGILDGIADLVSDVNDPSECNDFVAQLQDLAIRYDFHINGIIHFNPGSDKTRGHLGSQFERKAETNLRLDKIRDITTIWSEKQRRAPIPKGAGPSFCWNDDLQMHASCDKDPDQKSKSKGRPEKVRKVAFMNLHDFISACPPSGEGKREISRRLESWLATQNISSSDSTCRRAIDDMVANQKLTKDPSSFLFFKGPNA